MQREADAAMDAAPRASDAGTRASDANAWAIAAFAFFNGLVILGIALFHSYTPPGELNSALSFRAYFGLVALETAALVAPGCLVYLVIRRWLPRAALGLAVLLISSGSALYLIDLFFFLSLGEHLATPVAWNLLATFMPHLAVYVSASAVVRAGVYLAVWVAAQGGLWWLARALTRRFAIRLRLENPWAAAGLGCALVGLALAQPIWHGHRTLEEMRQASTRHPIAALGLVPRSQIQLGAADSEARVRGQAHLLGQADRIAAFQRRYAQLRADGPRTDLPDVVIIVAECIRSDAVTVSSAPHVMAMAQRGLQLRRHWSTGNSSNQGFFGLMFGLDACWFEYAREMPLGLFARLKDLGYQTALFGMDHQLDHFDMQHFISAERFDHLTLVDVDDPIACDRQVVQHARDFFDRTGPYTGQADAPRLGFVYLYSSHWEYYSPPEDRVHQPAMEGALALPIHPSDFDALFHRYLNSVHYIDRLIAPLLESERLVVFTGDHGEGFGEDGRFMHGSSLSIPQAQVACVIAGPGIEPRVVDRPTSHTDLFPTIVDAIGATLNDPSVLSGVSCIRPIPEDHVPVVRGFSSPETLFVTEATATLTQRLGYLGFVDFSELMMAPGAPVDGLGQPVADGDAGGWQGAAPMRRWLAEMLGPEMADIPVDPLPPIRRALASSDPAVRLQAVQSVHLLHQRGQALLDDLQPLLSDQDTAVRQAAFDVVVQLHHQSDG